MMVRDGANIEGNPFIIRFKTLSEIPDNEEKVNIEGNPFIIRFKTQLYIIFFLYLFLHIEGNPFIIRFKTLY